MKTILVTGSAGFIGANLVLRLLESQEPTIIVGLDNLNGYYDPCLKDYRLTVIYDKAKVHHLEPRWGRRGFSTALKPQSKGKVTCCHSKINVQ